MSLEGMHRRTMAKKKSFGSDRIVNPEFKAVARQHASECPTCGSAPFTSERDHNGWRMMAEEHMGKALPPTFLPKGQVPEAKSVNPNQSARQLSASARWAIQHPDNAAYDNDGNPVDKSVWFD